MTYIVVVAARWTKSLKFTLSIAVHRGGLAKNHFWLVATQKKRIGEQLNYFWNMCPKPFSWAKNKRKLFSDGKSRGPLLARVALKTREHQPPSIYWIHSTASYRECRTPTLLPRFSVSSMSCFRAKIIHKLTIKQFYLCSVITLKRVQILGVVNHGGVITN